MINVRGEGRSGGEEVIDWQLVKKNARAGLKQSRNYEEKLISIRCSRPADEFEFKGCLT